MNSLRLNHPSCIQNRPAILDSSWTLYYNNPDWQVLCEYDGSGNLQRSFIYGDYIDEVLVMKAADGSDYYYLHNHLYSPVALADDAGDVLERYEYDVYGKVTIRDTEYETRATSQYGNAYLFTGRCFDILDNGSLKIQYNRNRYYDYYIGEHPYITPTVNSKILD